MDISYLFIPGLFINSGFIRLLQKLNFKSLMNLIFLVPTCKYLEGIFNHQLEFLRFLILISLLPNLLIYFLSISIFALKQDLAQLEVSIHGLFGIVSGLLVALKFLIPEHTVKLFKGILAIRVKYLPFSFLLLSPIFCLVDGSLVPLELIIFGFFVSWIHLRFFYSKKDRSEAFSFVSFFPDFMHGLLYPISESIFMILVIFRICSRPSKEDLETGRSSTSQPRAPFNDVQETERRRALALKALETRLQYLQQGKQHSSLDSQQHSPLQRQQNTSSVSLPDTLPPASSAAVHTSSTSIGTASDSPKASLTVSATNSTT
jgi:hypothetical protein